MKSDPLGPAKIAADHARLAQTLMMKTMGRDEGLFEFAWSAYLNEYDRGYTLIFSALKDDLEKGKSLYKRLQTGRTGDELLNWLRVARNIRIIAPPSAPIPHMHLVQCRFALSLRSWRQDLPNGLSEGQKKRASKSLPTA